MILLPEKYKDLDISKEEKFFVSYIKNKFDDNTLLLVQVYPLRNTKNHIIIFDDSVCCIENLTLNNINMFNMIIDSLLSLAKNKLNDIKLKLLQYRGFNDENENLNIDIFYKYYIGNFNKSEIENEKLTEEQKVFIDNSCIFKDQMTQVHKNDGSLMEIFVQKDDTKKREINNEMVNSLIHIIAPEYTIPTIGDVSEVINIDSDCTLKNAKEYLVDDSFKVSKILRLDSNQINIVNNIKPGNQLMLACAGSGKSVILLSKCFKIASKHYDEEFLITCYNNNLRSMYSWRIEAGGFKERNIKVVTFHKLCQMLLDKINVKYEVSDFENTFKLAKYYLKNGKITHRFMGIFIDEVQIFKPEWYEFCYDLLKNKDDDKHFFVISGDKSQNVANDVKRGRAPWQGNDRLPNYRGKSLRLEKNYRNSIEINDFINNFTEVAKKYSHEFNIGLEEDTDSILRGNSFRNGDIPEVIITDRFHEKETVVDVVSKLNKEKGISLIDIAILFGNKQYKTDRYFIYTWVKKELEKQGIDYSEISTDKLEDRVRYGEHQGVILSTVQSALGLDFKAVVLCGIYPLGSHNETKKERDLMKISEEGKDDFLKNINTIYTAASRARDNLIIVSSESEDKSIYTKMIKEALH